MAESENRSDLRAPSCRSSGTVTYSSVGRCGDGRGQMPRHYHHHGEKNNVRLQMARTTICQQMRLLDGPFYAILHRSKSIRALLEVMKGNIAVKITPPLVLAGHLYKTMCLKAACADTLPIWNLSCYKGAAATLGNLFRSSEWLGSALVVVEDGVDLLHDGSYLWSELRNGRQDSDMVRMRIRRTASRSILSWL